MKTLLSLIFFSLFLAQDLYCQCSSPLYLNGCKIKINCQPTGEPVIWDMGDGTRLISNGGGIVHTYRGGGNYRVVASDGSYNRTVSPPCPTNNSGDSGNNNQPPKICSSITVFPSPAKLNTATGKTTFKFNFSNSRLNSSRFNYSWQLFDSGNGQRVASGKSSPNSTITVAGLKATTYELRVQCPTRKWEGRRFYVIRD